MGFSYFKERIDISESTYYAWNFQITIPLKITIDEVKKVCTIRSNWCSTGGKPLPTPPGVRLCTYEYYVH